MNPIARRTLYLSAFPPDGEPYLTAGQMFEWPKGAVKATSRPGSAPRRRDPRQGHRGGHRPAAGGSSVQFDPGPTRDAIRSDSAPSWPAGPDGSFQLAVPPGKGYLVIRARRADYILREIGSADALRGPAGWPARVRPRASSPTSLKAGEPALEINAVLRRGVTVQGPRRRARTARRSADACILSRIHARPESHHHGGLAEFFQLRHGPQRPLRAARPRPRHEVPVYFLDPKHESARRSSSPASGGRRGRSPSGSSRAARPRRGSSAPTASRSPDIAARA